MRLFFWRNNRDIDRAATELVNNFFGSTPPEKLQISAIPDRNKKNKAKDDRKVERSIATLLQNVNQFKILQNLGLYGKARLHLKLRIRLQELGYDEATIQKLNEYLLLHAD